MYPQQPWQPQPAPVPPASLLPKPHPAALVALTVWRLGVAACAGYGVYLILGGRYGHGIGSLNWNGLYELSQLGSFVVCFVYVGLALWPLFTGGRTHEPRQSWLRGALAVVMLLISLTSILIIGPKLDQTGFLFEHLITPIVVVFDFLFIGKTQYRTRFWYPFTWLALPLAYFVFLMSTGVQSYRSIFDPDNSAFVPTVAGFLFGLLVVGYVLWAATKVLGIFFAPKPVMVVVPQYVQPMPYWPAPPR